MKKHFAYLLTIATLVATSAAWAKSKVRAPSTETSPIRVVVTFQDKITVFLIEPTAAGATLSRPGKKEQRQITNDDLAYVRSQAASIHRQTNDQELCPRQYIEIESSIGKSIGCIGSKTPAARAATALANLLNALT